MSGANAGLSKRIDEIKESSRPPELQLVKIVDSSCTECFDINQISSAVQSLNVKITKTDAVEYSSDMAKQLISQLGDRKSVV